MSGKLKQLLSYTVGDDAYQNFALKTIIGEEFETADALEKLKRTPVDSGIPFKALQMLAPPTPSQGERNGDAPELVQVSQDPVFSSFAYGADPRGLLVNIVTKDPEQMAFDTTVSLVALPDNARSFWSALAKDITVLDKTGAYALTNPHGLVGMNGKLYTGNLDNRTIYIIEKNELNGLKDSDTHTLINDSVDVGALANLQEGARGQALFPASAGGQKYLNMLFIVYEIISIDPLVVDYLSSILVRLSVDNSTGDLTFKDKTQSGRNTQAVSMMKDGAGVNRLVMASVGGMQNTDITNGTQSYISSVPAFGAPWPVSAQIHLTGDTLPADRTGFIPVVYDIRTIDIAFRGRPDDVVVIFTGIYTNYYQNFSYAVYTTTAAKLLALDNVTISEAAAAGAITFAFGETSAPGEDLWDICIAMGATPDEDVLWFRGGSQIHAMLVKDLGKPDVRDIVYGSGLGPCTIGGTRINSVDITSETVRQAQTKMPKKRSLRGTPPEIRTQAKPESKG